MLNLAFNPGQNCAQNLHSLYPGENKKKNLPAGTNRAHSAFTRGAQNRDCGSDAARERRTTAMSQPNLRLVEGTFVDKTKALDAALSQIERAFGKGSIMRLGKTEGGRDRDDLHRIARARHRARRRRPAARPGGRNLRAGILGQDDADAACDRRSAEEGRRLRLRRRRTCARSGLCAQARRQSRRPADFPARHRRAGARDHRHAGALGRGRRAGHRFGRGADAARRNRGRDGRHRSRACRRG